ncbi:putative zinc-binding metallopeptidase, partial [Candidatus Pelagibacter sp.]|nr:putative zinc-binding metallopeptidase [Candidatus Pelagibacter sp.]
YFERVIHHEVFHIINDSFKELFDQNIWSSYNLKSFKYADCSTCTNKVGLDTYSSTEGFITEYSKSTASEDMAEIFSHLMTNSMPENRDLILEKKIKFIKAKISLISKDSGIFTQ